MLNNLQWFRNNNFWFFPRFLLDFTKSKKCVSQNAICEIQKDFTEVQKGISINKLLSDKDIKSLITWGEFFTINQTISK